MIAAGLDHLPEPGEVVFAPNGVRFRLGGHTGNVSVDLVQLGAPAGSVSIATAVGDDIAGRFLEEFLLSRGVDCSHVQRLEGVETGRSIVLVPSGKDRGFVLDEGANAHLSYDRVLTALDAVGPGMVYLACGILGGFDLRVGDLFARCRERGMATVLDAVRPHGKGWEFIHGALPHADVMHSSREEAAGIAGTTDPEEALSFLAARGVALPVMTDGARGLVARFAGRTIRQPSFKAEALDPTGAGDAFCAGAAWRLAAAMGAGRSLGEMDVGEVSELLLFAQAAGAACVGEIGTTPGVTAERVARLIEEQGPSLRARTTVG
jgi:ribokinase